MRHLRDRRQDLESAGITIFPISLDQPWSQRAWAESLSVDFRFLSDRLAETATAFGILTAYNEIPMAQRAVFLLRGDSVLESWKLTESPLPDVDAILVAASSSPR
ncbi:MAG: redoxin domain-containing protein [Actinobacteria bacterium]|nr:redoxin domain-containing protein [Actinomycetota bacterium]